MSIFNSMLKSIANRDKPGNTGFTPSQGGVIAPSNIDQMYRDLATARIQCANGDQSACQLAASLESDISAEEHRQQQQPVGEGARSSGGPGFNGYDPLDRLRRLTQTNTVVKR
jgi:hypothetical protein